MSADLDQDPEKDRVNESFATGSAADLNSDPHAWHVVTLLSRIDSVNHADLVHDIHVVLGDGAQRLALDLSQNRFFSLNAIQLCVSLAKDLHEIGGELAIVGCPERTKRHFEVYGSLKQIVVVRSLSELVLHGRKARVAIRRPQTGTSRATL